MIAQKETKELVVITGASGMLGVEIVKQLIICGYAVRALYNSNKPKLNEEILPAEWQKVDLADQNGLLQAIVGAKYVIHAAAFAKPWSKNPNTPYIINATGTKNVLEACWKNQVEKVVHVSTAGTFNPLDGEGCINENSQHKGPHFTDYEASKAMALDICTEYVKKGLNVSMVSPTRIFGSAFWSESNAVTKALVWYHNWPFFLMPGNGQTVGNYIHIQDVVTGVLLCMEKGAVGENYLLSAYNLSFRQLLNYWGKTINKSRLIVPVPWFLLRAVATIMEFSSKTFQHPPLITNRWISKYKSNRTAANKKAQLELGFSTITLEEALALTQKTLFTSGRITSKNP
jgi:farnesol dehydrogenase